MKQLTRLFLVLVLVAALLPLGTAAAATEMTPCEVIAAQLGAKVDQGEIAGAQYCIMYPNGLKWNRDVVVFAHGYVDARQPIGIPWDQVIRGDTNLAALVVNLGYAFATTSYHKNGLAITQGVEDIVNLVGHIKENPRAKRVFLTGASEGGAVTALAVEKFPTLFAGGLSTCGPIGSFIDQIEYWGDFRVAFDVVAPNVLMDPVGMSYGSSTPIFIDPVAVENFETMVLLNAQGWMAQNPTLAVGLLNATGVPYDINTPATVAESIGGLLYYNVEATNDGRRTLINMPDLSDAELASSFIGNPFSGVKVLPVPIPTDPDAIAAIQNSYETSGLLKRQLVVMHTTGDPIVPFAHTWKYLQKVIQKRSLSKLSIVPIDRYGHCNFTPAEMVFGFYVMVIRSTLMPFSSQQIQQALPDAASREKFDHLKTKFKDEVRGNNQ